MKIIGLLLFLLILSMGCNDPELSAPAIELAKSTDNLSGPNFEGAEVTIEQLCKASSLYGVQLDPDLQGAVMRECPELLGSFSGSIVSDRYDEGFNDALTCFMLLNLELTLTLENKTFGEMNDICRKRNGISKK